MTLREYEEVLADSEDRPAFSNGTIGYAWMDNWCGTCRNDSEELVDQGEGCPLIMVALLNRTPSEWKTISDHDRAVGNYTCTEYAPEEDDPDEPPPPDLDPIPGQGQLFDV